MKKLFLSTTEFDRRACVELGLDEKILMENAAAGIEKIVRKKLKRNSKILAVCGSGNNAADAVCAVRRLAGDFECEIFLASKKQNEMLKFQLDLARRVGVRICGCIEPADAIIDGIFGSGLNRKFDEETQNLISLLNAQKALKIAVDVPSGINKFGQIPQNAFKADYTVTMGARKIGLFSDAAKDFVGKIRLANLGISECEFAGAADAFLLQKCDLRLPKREKQNCNKGDFGHLFIVGGEMLGAAQIAGLAASAIGAGKVSVVTKEKANLHPTLMRKSEILGAKTLLCGSGLGRMSVDISEFKDKVCVFDADLCHKKEILEILDAKKIITPHPKEFASLLKNAQIADVSVDEIQENRFFYAREFSRKFDCVLVLKGANTVIARDGELFICALGNNALAFGGSGDALAGLIGGLLVQNYAPLDAAIQGVLIHALTSRKFRKKPYAMGALDIIGGVRWL